MESLDLLANNLANSGTPGFKADREAYRLYTAGESSREMQTGNPSKIKLKQSRKMSWLMHNRVS